MEVRVTLEAGAALEYMRKGQQSVRFAAANALNETAKRIQKAERAHVQTVFRLRPRGGAFVLRQSAVIPKPWASARGGALAVTVKVGTAPRLLLSKFETGESKLPDPGRTAIAIPIKARPSFTENVPRRMFIESFRLQRKGNRIVGAKRTFVEPGVGIMDRDSNADCRMKPGFCMFHR